MNVYLDYQAAKPVDPRVTEAMLPYFYDHFGNPSSLHKEGDEAEEILERSRGSVAHFINAEKDEIIFTSGATEANNMALIGYAMRNRDKGNHLIISEIEHISIHNIAKYLEKSGFEVTKIPVDQYGRVNIEKLEKRLTDKTILISIGYANDEIGTLQEIAEIGKIAGQRTIAFHCDAVAAEGLVPLDVQKDHIDLLSLSSNDIYGPKGVGALYVRKGVKTNPLIIGGGQEKGLRSGTENIAGVVGMSKAAEIMEKEMDEEVKRLTTYRDLLLNHIPKMIPKCQVNGHLKKRLPNNAHFRFQGIEGESLLLSLNDKGIAVSTGSACSSKTLEPSHTLISLGLLHEEAHGSLELTCGRFNKEEDIHAVLEVLPAIVHKLRDLSPIYNQKE